MPKDRMWQLQECYYRRLKVKRQKKIHNTNSEKKKLVACVYELKRISRIKKQFMKIEWPIHQESATTIQSFHKMIKFLNKWSQKDWDSREKPETAQSPEDTYHPPQKLRAEWNWVRGGLQTTVHSVNMITKHHSFKVYRVFAEIDSPLWSKMNLKFCKITAWWLWTIYILSLSGLKNISTAEHPRLLWALESNKTGRPCSCLKLKPGKYLSNCQSQNWLCSSQMCKYNWETDHL